MNDHGSGLIKMLKKEWYGVWGMNSLQAREPGFNPQKSTLKSVVLLF